MSLAIELVATVSTRAMDALRANEHHLSSRISLWAALGLMSVASCSSSDRGADLEPSASGPTGDPGPESSVSGTGSADASSDDGAKFDVNAGTTGGPADEGCTKIDFLFVVDNSYSMANNQQNLVDSFPGFMTAIEDTVMAQDYQIMVTDIDYVVPGDLGPGPGGDSCSPHPECCDHQCTLGPTCNGVPCDSLDDCDFILGAGQVNDQYGAMCPIAGSQRYIVDGQPDLSGTFECLATVGIAASNEKQTESMVNAVTSPLLDAGGCNEGFVRSDALLVVTIITDEDDTQSTGDLAQWTQTLVDAKGGQEQAIVVLGLLPDSGVPNGVCQGEDDAPVLRDFTDSFTYGSWASVCEPDYVPFFTEAVGHIDTACDLFPPRG